MNACELTASITAIANILSTELTVNELNLWAAVLTQLGDTLATIAAQKAYRPALIHKNIYRFSKYRVKRYTR